MFPYRRIIALFAVLHVTLVFAQASPPQTPFQLLDCCSVPAPVLDNEFEDWLHSVGYEWGMKGVAISVTRRLKDEHGNWDGWTSETKGYGVADRWGTKVDEQTLFAIGSNSKLFTTLGIGLLTENKSHNIQWDTKIKDILPESQWKLQDNTAQDHADLVDILTHRIGLPRHDLSYSRTDPLARMISKLRYLRPSAEFRQTFQYNNQMFCLAAHIIEYVTGTPFHHFITEHILSPLGLNHTTYNVTEVGLSGRLAEGFLNTGSDPDRGVGKRKMVYKPVPFWSTENDFALLSGAGGIISNAVDLVGNVEFIGGQHPVTNTTIIPESVTSKAAQGVIFSNNPLVPELSPVVFGMGQATYSYQGHNLIEHNGGVIGQYSVITRAPDDGVGIAILTNADGNGPFLEMVKLRLIEKALGLKHIDWNTRFSKLATAEEKKHFAVSNDHNEQPRLPYSDLAGVYFHAAYGSLRLCHYQSSFNASQSSSAECREIIKEVAGSITGPIPNLIAAWPKVWSTHLLFYHKGNDLFDVSEIGIFPPPFPDASENDDDSRPFSVPFGNCTAKFMYTTDSGADSESVEGIAATGAWGAGVGVKDLKGVDRDSAEIWFDRII